MEKIAHGLCQYIALLHFFFFFLLDVPLFFYFFIIYLFIYFFLVFERFDQSSKQSFSDQTLNSYKALF